MRYEYQIDYGDGYEEAFPTEQERTLDVEKSSTAWLAGVEAEGVARRARVLSGGVVVEERDFTCAVMQSRVQPDGSTKYVVWCPGGQVTVERHRDGRLTERAQVGYVGDADLALQRAFEVVSELKDT
jgi:hypothetical protein